MSDTPPEKSVRFQEQPSHHHNPADPNKKTDEEIKRIRKLKAKKIALLKRKKALELGSNKKKRFDIRQWNAVGLWCYKINTDTCAICKESLHSPCIECTANSVTIPTAEMAENDEAIKSMCTIVFGACGHAFHQHCMRRWLKMATSHAARCPVCNSEWDEVDSDFLLK